MYPKIVRGKDYFKILNTSVRSEAEIIPQYFLFQHFVVYPHITCEVRSVLNPLFPNFWIGRCRPAERSARSPNMSSPDFFLSGFVENTVFETPINNVTKLKRIILTAIKSVTQSVLNNVWKNLKLHLMLLLETLLVILNIFNTLYTRSMHRNSL